MNILALDLGKFKSVACMYDTDGVTIEFTTVDTKPQAIHDLLVENAPNRVVFETCGIAGWVHDLATALELDIQVANPSHEAWRWNKVKRKTDKDDALKLAKMSAMNELPTVWMPSPTGRQYRRLVLHRSKLKSRLTAIKNEIRSILQQQAIAMASAQKAWTKVAVQMLQKYAKPIEQCDMNNLWRGRLHLELICLEQTSVAVKMLEKKLEQLGAKDDRIRRLRTVPGVGPRLSEAVVATIGDPHRFRNGRQVAAYVGLVPKQYQSGTMNRHGRITRRGPRLLRTMLVEVAWLAYRYNPWGHAFVEHVSKGQKSRRKQAIVALARKLLIRLWAMLRDGTDWKPRHRLAVN